MEEKFLIIGLGNPGTKYEKTRHNVGFLIASAFAEQIGAPFKSELRKVKGSLAQGMVGEKKVMIVMPMTYMNESGLAVKKALDYFKIPPKQSLVITDDVALPFNQLRLREKGGAGGHNGLKSIQAHLGTEEYPRLRVGVGAPHEEQDLADYVLERFSKEEWEQMPTLVERACDALKNWLTQGMDVAMRNVHKPDLGENKNA